MPRKTSTKKAPAKKAPVKKTPGQKRAAGRAKAADKARDMFAAMAEGSKRARRMSEVETFKIVPTNFVGFNRATQVGGAPLSCVWLLHGPSMGGKTAFACGLIKSFQAAGGLPLFVDAELAADTKRWFRSLGVDPSRCLYVGRTGEEEVVNPLTYEEIVEEVDGAIARYQKGKKEGTIRKDVPLLIVVDSISKMVPQDLLKKLEKKDGGKALRGGVGRIQALLNTAWLAELGVKVGDDNIAFVVIAHEMEKENPGSYVSGFKVRGGGALIYDSMVQARVTYAGAVRDLAAEGAPIVGKRHRVKLLKNKHGPAFGESYFYTATGKGMAPMGFDVVREVVHEGILSGLLDGPKLSGPNSGSLTLGSRISYAGESWALKQLYGEPGVIDSISRALEASLVEDESVDEGEGDVL